MQFVHEYGATVTEVVNHEFVVDDFVANVDGRPEHIQRAVHDFYGAVYAGAEASGVCQSDLHYLAFAIGRPWAAGMHYPGHAVNTSM
ncbi:hypothetical protein GCM10008110_17440 [Marinobacter persicus]|nr:hypothetical protein GCM10008110_17440 [Marinobacter persicus]